MNDSENSENEADREQPASGRKKLSDKDRMDVIVSLSVCLGAALFMTIGILQR